MKLPSDFDYFPSSVLCNEGTLSMKAGVLVPSPPGICISGFPSVKEKRGGKCGNNLYPSQASPVGPETLFPRPWVQPHNLYQKSVLASLY